MKYDFRIKLYGANFLKKGTIGVNERSFGGLYYIPYAAGTTKSIAHKIGKEKKERSSNWGAFKVVKVRKYYAIYYLPNYN